MKKFLVTFACCFVACAFAASRQAQSRQSTASGASSLGFGAGFSSAGSTQATRSRSKSPVLGGIVSGPQDDVTRVRQGASVAAASSESPAMRAQSPAHSASVVASQSRGVTAGSATAGVTASSASIPRVLSGEDVPEETRHCASVLDRMLQKEIAPPGLGKPLGRLVYGSTISDIARQLKAREDQNVISSELQTEGVRVLLEFFAREDADILVDHGLENVPYVLACFQKANYRFDPVVVEKILPFLQRYKKQQQTNLVTEFIRKQQYVEDLKVVEALLVLRRLKGQRGHSPTTGYRSPRTALATMLAHPAGSQQQ